MKMFRGALAFFVVVAIVVIVQCKKSSGTPSEVTDNKSTASSSSEPPPNIAALDTDCKPAKCPMTPCRVLLKVSDSDDGDYSVTAEPSQLHIAPTDTVEWTASVDAGGKDSVATVQKVHVLKKNENFGDASHQKT